MTLIQTHSLEETEQLGQELSARIIKGDCLALNGELGAGKTSLVRALVRGVDPTCEDLVSSPTFSLLNIYPTQIGPICHFDLYRLNTMTDLFQIDFEEHCSESNICIVEWANKFPNLARYINKIISISVSSPHSRSFEIDF